ncbi:MAG: hypothetical protein ACN4GT_06470 [Gammaproteobacteria bacterium]
MKQEKTCAMTSAAVAAALLMATSVAGAEGLARGQVYSTAAVNKVCGDAQQIVTSTNLEVNNVILSEWDAFVQSDAAPYSVVGFFPPLAYSPPEEPDLPLTSTQHVIYGMYGTGNRDFPQVVSCKMKNAAYLNAAPEIPVSDAMDQSCAAVNTDLVGRVLASLTNPEQYQVIVESDGEVLVDEDQTDTMGFAWTAGFPDNPYPVLYREVENGPLHVKASALVVDPHPFGVIQFVCNDLVTSLPPGVPIPSFCEPRKWGVRYCHVPGAEYIRAALTGEVEVPIIPGGPQPPGPPGGP